jgi:hypothetical protein
MKAMLSRVLLEAWRLAFWGHSRLHKAIQIAVWLIALILPFGVTVAVNISIQLNPPVSWTMSLGVLITIMILLVVIPASLAVAYYMTPRLEFLDEELDPGSWHGHYRVVVANTSKWKTINKCYVRIAKAWPRIPHIPVLVHSPQSLPVKDGIIECPLDIPGNSRRTWDLIINDKGNWRLAAANSEQREIIPTQPYLIMVLAEGEDTPAITQFYVFVPNADGTISFRVATEEEKRKQAATHS